MKSDCKADDGANGTFIILHTCCCGDVSELWCLTRWKMDIFTTLYPVQYMFVIQGFLLDNIFKQWSRRTLIARLVSMKRKFKHNSYNTILNQQSTAHMFDMTLPVSVSHGGNWLIRLESSFFHAVASSHFEVSWLSCVLTYLDIVPPYSPRPQLKLSLCVLVHIRNEMKADNY